jgi:hypothetical protein
MTTLVPMSLTGFVSHSPERSSSRSTLTFGLADPPPKFPSAKNIKLLKMMRQFPKSLISTHNIPSLFSEVSPHPTWPLISGFSLRKAKKFAQR